MSALDDSYLGPLCLYREARGETDDAKRGVYHVLLNRVADGRFPDSLAEVVLQRKQFSSFNPGDPNAVLIPHTTDPAWIACCAVAAAPGDDPTGGATHYHSYSNPDSYPAWADPAKHTVDIGHFHFYKL